MIKAPILGFFLKRVQIYPTIMEFGPKRPSSVWFWAEKFHNGSTNGSSWFCLGRDKASGSRHQGFARWLQSLWLRLKLA